MIMNTLRVLGMGLASIGVLSTSISVAFTHLALRGLATANIFPELLLPYKESSVLMTFFVTMLGCSVYASSLLSAYIAFYFKGLSKCEDSQSLKEAKEELSKRAKKWKIPVRIWIEFIRTFGAAYGSNLVEVILWLDVAGDIQMSILSSADLLTAALVARALSLLASGVVWLWKKSRATAVEGGQGEEARVQEEGTKTESLVEEKLVDIEV